LLPGESSHPSKTPVGLRAPKRAAPSGGTAATSLETLGTQGQLATPAGVLAVGNDVYVSDSVNNNVTRFHTCDCP
jgi:hypothetical protein